MLTVQPSGGSTYSRVFNFGRFSSLEVGRSTYMQITLYAGVYGIVLN